MGFIPQITCRHCGKKFSALHSRCPHCGARHVKQTSRATPTTASVQSGTAASARAGSNTQWQFIFGCILIVAVIVAVIVLISASLSGNSQTDDTELPDTPIDTVEPIVPPTVPPTPSPMPTPTVTSVSITYAGSTLTEFTQRLTWGSITLTAVVYPTDALDELEVEWSSSDESVCTISEDSATTATVTPVASGECTITATCGGVSTSCRVLVP